MVCDWLWSQGSDILLLVLLKAELIKMMQCNSLQGARMRKALPLKHFFIASNTIECFIDVILKSTKLPTPHQPLQLTTYYRISRGHEIFACLDLFPCRIRNNPIVLINVS